MKRLRLAYYVLVILLSCLPMFYMSNTPIYLWSIISLRAELQLSLGLAVFITLCLNITLLLFIALLFVSIKQVRERFEMVTVYLSCFTSAISMFGFMMLLAYRSINIDLSVSAISKLLVLAVGFVLIRGMGSYKETAVKKQH